MTGAGAGPPRRAGRPRTPVLSRATIIETGLRLLDERGSERTGMRDIARELGVRPSALYNHVSGRGDLLAGVRELMGERMDTSAFGSRPWDEALAVWARSYRETFAAHPPTIAVLGATPLAPDSRTSAAYDLVLRALEEAGWPPARALALIVALESFLLGSALDAAADDTMMDPGPRADVPTFSRAYAEHREAARAAGIRPADAAFEAGLAAMLAGFRAELRALVAD
ncbi:TetR/AcrR family transcriptional regulator C-terminal domain-containing protein [Leucobacter sp. CSA1]|uniref:TetR/AcrR family transcriptional regulator C-terminal domain-containing protein n=1 Tax=Leucobacter chromiisoli TaxID=2796471 RepID=A0A934Q9T2_9MICO|nr:TetR/AcrR family transcriptional regulator C-terminal domain-containing protein [Leucobacter chromiisoli]MBK0419905.1 TetR/AcrR family transcriptional regulator C-terminal domain-containing protein [Leucobacter chromiisoli]